MENVGVSERVPSRGDRLFTDTIWVKENDLIFEDSTDFG